MVASLSHYYKTTVWLVALLVCWLSAEAQTRTVQLQSGKLVYTITNLGESFTVIDEDTEIDQEILLDCNHIITSDVEASKLSAGTEINVDVTYYPNNDGEGACSQLKLVANTCLTCINGNNHLNREMKFKGTIEEFFNDDDPDWNYDYTTRKSPHQVTRTFRVNHDITKEEALFYIKITYYERNNITVPYDCAGGYDSKFAYAETITARCVAPQTAQENTDSIDSADLDQLDPHTQYLDPELLDVIMQLFGLDKHATPTEAVTISSLAALLALLLGGAGAAGGGAGGSIPPPIEEGPSGPPPVQDPYQDIKDKYVTRHPDGSITVKDPVTGERRLYLPDGEGGYDNPLGGGYKSEEAMLDHLAMLDRNSATLSQDAATAAQNKAEQHAQWEAQNARDLARGYSDEMAEYRKWKADQERELKKEERISKLAGQYGVEATEEAVKRAIKMDQIKSGIESAKQEAEAADNNVWVVGLESTRNVAATSLVLIPLAASGAGVLSASSLAEAKLVQSCFTMANSVTQKVGDAYVSGEDMGKAAVHGVVTGAVEVAQNYAGEIGGKAAGLLPGASNIAKTVVNYGTEAAVVIGGEGFKAGYDEYTSSGDLNKTLDATIKGLKDGTKKHAINKTMEFGINKAKDWATSGKPTVESTRAHADATGKNLTSSQQAATRAQNQLSKAQQRATKAQQNAVRSQQLVTKAKGDVNAANNQLRTANKEVTAAQKKLNDAKTPAEMSKAKADLANAQRGAEQAQQNVDRANSNLKMTEKVDAAARRVAPKADNNLQRAQWGAQKAQRDLKTANEQHNQALRDAYAAEQQAQIDKTVAHASGSDVVSGYRSLEDFQDKQGKLSKEI